MANKYYQTNEEVESENFNEEHIVPFELEEQERHDKILEIFKKSVEEQPASVEDLFQDLIQDRITELVFERKKQIAEEMSGVDRPLYDDEDDVSFPDELDSDEELDFEEDEAEEESLPEISNHLLNKHFLSK